MKNGLIQAQQQRNDDRTLYSETIYSRHDAGVQCVIFNNVVD